MAPCGAAMARQAAGSPLRSSGKEAEAVGVCEASLDLRERRVRQCDVQLAMQVLFMDPRSLHRAEGEAEECWKYPKEKYNEDRVVVNVGGQCFETSRQTLCKDEHSMLTALVRNDAALWIDRDGQRFTHVLNYLRNGTIWLSDTSLLRGIIEEAEFFCLSGLQELCEEKIDELEVKEIANYRTKSHARNELQETLEENFRKLLKECHALRESVEEVDWKLQTIIRNQH